MKTLYIRILSPNGLKSKVIKTQILRHLMRRGKIGDIRILFNFPHSKKQLIDLTERANMILNESYDDFLNGKNLPKIGNVL